jgi:hydrogenase maturation protein HypF
LFPRFLLVSNLSIKKYDRKGVELLIHGIVQGVGFRPFVHNLATRLGISGTVSNSSAGVLIRAFADQELLKSFQDLLQKEAPPLARIFSIVERPLDADLPEGIFTILASVTGDIASAGIPPDIALCDDCLMELLRPDDRRAGYPFINCTNCGPRFTIVETIPYDRPKTSMKIFPMCATCSAEYSNPKDRRFHAQPNACPVCGPHLSWHDRRGNPLSCNDPVAEAITALRNDKILAIRGLGGFHLAVNGCSDPAVLVLRDRKGRKAKPLAIMVASIDSARDFANISDLEEKTLLSLERPIVLLKKKERSSLAEALAPGVGDIGIMLPYTPLHHLLFQHEKSPAALVMTSGNVSGSPICTGNEEAIHRLGGIADYFLLHNRDIVTRIDDSVVRISQKRSRVFRRARGYVPAPLLLSCSLPSVIGCGGGLKNTFCLSREKLAYPSQHIGDLTNIESFDFYTESVEHLKKVFEIEPAVAACDLHPDYMSSHYAADLGLPLYRIQHHHAHAVAVMAEHGLSEPVLAIILDGTGYGPDGSIWGGEFLLTDLVDYKRLGHLQQLSLPGGDIAAMEPWRMGCSALFHTFGEDALLVKNSPSSLKTIAPERREIIAEMIKRRFNTPLTSSCGRLFDAAAALLGIRLFTSYEGQAAMELESLAWKAATENWKSRLDSKLKGKNYSWLLEENGIWQVVTSNLVIMICDCLSHGKNPANIALRFHFELIGSILTLIRQLSAQTGIREIVLSGGCLQNRLLLEGLFHVLLQENFQVFTGSNIPVNDGGISVGQAIIGGLQHVSCHTHAGNKN